MSGSKRIGEYSKQCGIALIVGLMVLLALTILAVAIVQVVTLQGKMTRNQGDQTVAFQAAEAALRAAEMSIASGIISGETSAATPTKQFVSNFNFAKFTAACSIDGQTDSYGRCLPSATSTPQWQAVSWSAASTNTIGVAFSLPADVASPRYIVELLSGKPVYDPSFGCTASLFRITARGYGPNDAVKNLQSVYRYQATNCI